MAIVQCEQCGLVYDDVNRWTICPHGPLWAPVEAYCRKCDLVFCQEHTPREIIDRYAPRASDRQPIMLTTWCGSRVDVRGRFWRWAWGWISAGWRPGAFRMRREARAEFLKGGIDGTTQSTNSSDAANGRENKS